MTPDFTLNTSDEEKKEDVNPEEVFRLADEMYPSLRSELVKVAPMEDDFPTPASNKNQPLVENITGKCEIQSDTEEKWTSGSDPVNLCVRGEMDSAENLNGTSQGKEEVPGADKEITDEQGGIWSSETQWQEGEPEADPAGLLPGPSAHPSPTCTGPDEHTVPSAESVEKDEEATQKRYHLRERRKPAEDYQPPLKKSGQSESKVSDQSSGARQRSPFGSPRRLEDSCCQRTNSCLPLNFQEDDLKGTGRDCMKTRARLADVGHMQTDRSVRFHGVGGLSDHISALKEMVIFPLLYPEVFQRFQLKAPRGCLFYGPPGTGKTLVARALANEYSRGDRRIAFFMRKGADCLSQWAGESERQLRVLFERAYQMRPSIIFFDEIDGLAPVRSNNQDHLHSSIVTTLLALMDGFDSRGEVVVIRATNRLDSIDPALRRPGRFDREFLFSLPDTKARKEILEIHTQHWSPKPPGMLLEELADKCVGYCGADIEALCAEAVLCALRRHYPQIYRSNEKLPIDVDSLQVTAEDFLVAMEKITPASQRTLASPGRALCPISKPLLENSLARILQALQRVFPHAAFALRKDHRQGSLNPVLRNEGVDSDEESPSTSEEMPPRKKPRREERQFLDLSRTANYQPMCSRPRFLLVGEPGYGQTSHLAPAVIHALHKFPIYTLDLPALFAGNTSLEEKCAQMRWYTLGLVRAVLVSVTQQEFTGGR
ncbi:ATPase family AAA domain-containing protein 2-like [Porphyrio hochstetteri]